MKYIYKINISDLTISYSFVYPQTARFFSPAISTSHASTADIVMTEKYLTDHRWLSSQNSTELYHEYRCCMVATGDYLLRYKMALFHGAAIIWKDKAWLFTGPSGVGKTTQLMLWKNSFKDEIKFLNGDKPVIQCLPDGNIDVCSSPWKGKENIGIGNLRYPLGGIILLEQAKINSIKRMTAKEAVKDLFIEFISSSDTIEQITMQAGILSQMLDTVPVWKLLNRGDQESVHLTHKTILRYLEKEYGI